MSVGDAVGAFTRDLWAQAIEPTEEAAGALAEFVDEEFRRHCRVAGWVQGVLAIHVDEQAVLGLMRMKWSTRIKRELPGRLSRRLNRVVFSSGQTGTPVGSDHLLD